MLNTPWIVAIEGDGSFHNPRKIFVRDKDFKVVSQFNSQDVAEKVVALVNQNPKVTMTSKPDYPRCPICKDDSAACPKTYSGGNVGPACPF